MQISFIGHASILIETQGLRILSDPWWRGPCFGAQWWNYPQPDLSPLDRPVDFIYVSHGHHDHLHAGTLRTLNKNAKVLVSRNIDIGDPIRELGFEVIALGDQDEYALSSSVKCRLIETYSADTLLAVSDGSRVCVNLNDALHAAPDDVQERFISLLNRHFPRIDYLFCGYGVASHFPNCYVIPGKDPARTAAKRQAYFNRRWSRIVAGLHPQYAFPFAANVGFFEHDLQWSNEPTHNTERPTDVFRQAHPDSPAQVFDIAPGFQITDDTVSRAVYRSPVSLAKMREEMKEAEVRANEYGTGSEAMFEEVLGLVRDNIKTCAPYLDEYAGNYRFWLRFRNCAKGIAIVKQGRQIGVEPSDTLDQNSFDVIYTTRLQYIRWSLTSKYGHEILFVGSGGIFEYHSAARARENVHREFMTMLLPHDSPPRSRYGDQAGWLYKLKQRVRAMTGNQRTDLYDLGTWTVWDSTPK